MAVTISVYLENNITHTISHENSTAYIKTIKLRKLSNITMRRLDATLF